MYCEGGSCGSGVPAQYYSDVGAPAVDPRKTTSTSTTVAPVFGDAAHAGHTTLIGLTTGQQSGGCTGSANIFQAGTRLQTVDCPSQRLVTETVNVPRTVYTTRKETRIRQKMVKKVAKVPEVKYHTQVKYVTQTRKIPITTTTPVTTIKDVIYTEPVEEKYDVHVPVSTCVTETQTRHKLVPTRKKCNVQVPVFSAKCASGNTGTF